jgi:hypothetical protein
MKGRWIVISIFLLMATQSFSGDILETRKGVKYCGKIIKIQDTKEGKAVVIKTDEGGTVAVFQKEIARIYRDNQVLDFMTGERYYVEVRRPYLPFAVLGIATGAYAVNRFQEYNRLHDKAERERELAGVDAETINTSDQKNAMALGIVSSLLSVGSFYVAIRPMEIKVPMGKINLSGIPKGVRLSLHF